MLSNQGPVFSSGRPSDERVNIKKEGGALIEKKKKKKKKERKRKEYQ
jgi:hypothetical protein